MINDVEALLKEKKVHYKEKGKDFLVHCLNPEHEDSSPSMRIDRGHGMFHCLSCGYKGNLFSYYNKYRNVLIQKVKEIEDKIADIKKASWAGLSIPPGAELVNNEFRGIPAEILQKFGAFRTNELGMENRIVFPITDPRGCIVGFQGRYEFSKESPKYLMYPKECSLPWYPAPYNLEMINRTIIITEGLLDALFLHGTGLTNAICTFGTKATNINNIVDYLTPYILSGCHRVVLLMDGDASGRSAAEFLHNIITVKTDLIVDIFELPDDTDPAEINLKTLNKLKRFIDEDSTGTKVSQ